MWRLARANDFQFFWLINHWGSAAVEHRAVRYLRPGVICVWSSYFFPRPVIHTWDTILLFKKDIQVMIEGFYL